MKSDLIKSGSTWTVDILEKYVQYEDVGFACKPKFELPVKLRDYKIITEVMETVMKMALAVVTTGNEKPSGEYDARILLDEMLLPLCAHRGLTLNTCTEILHKCDMLPNNRYDYIIYHDYQAIGCVEAKRLGSLESKSLVQLILQLLLRSVRNSKPFYFGILSNACHFVFVGLCEQKVLFFQEDNHESLREEKNNSESRDLEPMIQTRLSFLDHAIDQRKNPT